MRCSKTNLVSAYHYNQYHCALNGLSDTIKKLEKIMENLLEHVSGFLKTIFHPFVDLTITTKKE